MSHHEANNLILEHLRLYGYQLEARILEKEFHAKEPKPSHDNSKLMEFLRKGIGKLGDSSRRTGFGSAKKNNMNLTGTLGSNRSASLKSRSIMNKRDIAPKSPLRPSDHVYQHIIKHPALPKDLSDESDTVTDPSLPHIGSMSKDRANSSFGVDNHSDSYYNDGSYHNFYDNNPYPYHSRLNAARKAVLDPYPHSNIPLNPEPYYRNSRRTLYNKSIQPPRHLYANKQPLSYKPDRLSRTPSKSPHQKSSLSANNSFVTRPANREYEQEYMSNPADKHSYPNLVNRNQSVPNERPAIVDKFKPVANYKKAPTAFGARNRSTFTQNYNAFISNPQRGENGPVYVGDRSQTNYRSHVSLVHDFLVNEKKEVTFDNSINPKPPRFMPKDQEDSSTSLRKYNDRLNSKGRIQYDYGYSPIKVDFNQDASQFGRNGEPLNKRESNVYGEAYVPVVKRANVRMDPKVFEFLLTNSFFSESEIRNFFEVYLSLVYNPTQAMNKKTFKQFISQTKSINGEHFTDCLFHFGPQISLIASTNGIIEFQEAVVILDRLNQDNPFSLMHFIFRLTVGDGEKRASLSLIETILKEIKPANMKGRVGLLLDSLEFIYTHEGNGRSGHISFEEYLEIMKRFEPLRKFS